MEGNYPGTIIQAPIVREVICWRRFSGWQLSGGQLSGGNFPGGLLSERQLSGDSYPEGNYPIDNCPGVIIRGAIVLESLQQR